jgi:hypothetical protein
MTSNFPPPGFVRLNVKYNDRSTLKAQAKLVPVCVIFMKGSRLLGLDTPPQQGCWIFSHPAFFFSRLLPYFPFFSVLEKRSEHFLLGKLFGSKGSFALRRTILRKSCFRSLFRLKDDRNRILVNQNVLNEVSLF